MRRHRPFILWWAIMKSTAEVNYCRSSWSLAPEDQVDSREDKLQGCCGQNARTLGKGCAVYGDDLRHVRNGVSREPGRTRKQQDVTWCIRQREISGDTYANHSSEPASVERVSLDHDERPTISGLRPARLGKICPPRPLRDHHSLWPRARRAASFTKRSSSSDSPATSRTAFSLSVTSSEEWRRTYSRRASAYTSLRDRPDPRTRCSTASKSSSGREIAVFIPGA